MKQPFHSFLSLAAGTVFLLATGCGASRMATNQTIENQPAVADSRATATSAAAAQTADADVQPPFSAAAALPAVAPAPATDLLAANTAPQTVSVQSLRQQLKQKPMSLPKRMLVNSALKKMEKLQAKADVKKIKAAREGKGIPGEYRSPIILGAVGLALIIIGSFGIGILWVLGSIALAAAAIWFILILAEVI